MSAAEDLEGMDPLTRAFGWGHLKDHWQKCDECGGTGKDGDTDLDGPPDDCSVCDGAGRLRWGSFYHQDRGRCASCTKDDVAIAQMYEGASGCGDDWVCLDCYVDHHQTQCGCKRWKKAELMREAGGASRPPTELEAVILRRLANGEEPWGVHTGNGSRTTSQAIARCIRLGWVHFGYGEDNEHDQADYRLTRAGRELRCVKNCIRPDVSPSSSDPKEGT